MPVKFEKFCIDCKHCKIVSPKYEDEEPKYFCEHPDMRNVINGRPRECYLVRSGTAECGYTGNLFEPRAKSS